MAFRQAATSALVLVSISICGSAWAYVEARDEYQERLKVYQSVRPGDDAHFGENENLYSGSLSFTQSDIRLEGTGPTIELTRTYRPLEFDEPDTVGFGDWEVNIPYITTLTPAGPNEDKRDWLVFLAGEPSTARCTNFGYPYNPKKVIRYGGVDIEDWWRGYQMVLPGVGTQDLLKRAAGNTQQPAGTYPAVTIDHWQIGCLPSTSNGEPGEGFLAISPDGTKYWFDHLSFAPYSKVFASNFPTDPPPYLTRKRAKLSLSRIEDRFGNWVAYQYSGDHVIDISAKDGRHVAIEWWNDAPVIKTITVQPGTAHARSWHYNYTDRAASTRRLNQVVLPDSSAWLFDMQVPRSRPYVNTRPGGCFTGPNDTSGGATSNGPLYVSTMTHPSGLVGNFTVQSTPHAQSDVPSFCATGIDGSPSGEVIWPTYANWSLVKKVFSGPGLAPLTWQYTYSPTAPSMLRFCSASGTCAGTSYVDVRDPASVVNRYTFSTRWDATEGRLLRVDYGFAGGASARTDTVTYAVPAGGKPDPSSVGTSMQGWRTNTYRIEAQVPEQKRVIAQQGVIFTWEANAFDPFNLPTNITRSSSLGYSRNDVTTYSHSTALWVIGQPASSTNTNTGLIESQTDYWIDTALPQRTWAFGKAQQYFTYYNDGTLASVTDGNNHSTSYADWKRGIPQTVTYADASGQSAQINDLGQIEWVKNAVDARTCYGYDAIGRVNLIKYPSETQSNVCNEDKWLATTISFAPSVSPVYGLAANHWRRTESTGNARKVTFYDALWRPAVQEVYDIGNTWNTIIQTVNRYDADGRVVYASYPQRNADPAVYNTWANPAVSPNALGTVTAYDVLGRPTQVTWNSELGILGSTTEYLSGFQTRTTNARGYPTVAQYQTFDQPTTDAPTGITALGGAVSTEIQRDVFGKPTLLKRRNGDGTLSSSRTYSYDQYQQLCKTTEPETGATLLGYDAAGNLTWSSAGLAAATPCEADGTSAPAMARRVNRSYDTRNRLKSLAFPDGRGDQWWDYWADGLVQKITTWNEAAHGGQVENHFVYNNRRLLTAESQIQLDQPVWGMTYGYSGNAALATLGYGTGLTVNYAPNAIGQPTQAGTYATGVSYYPNGGMQQFTYGNGIVHTMIQNDRQLPEQSVDSGGMLNDSYDYDANGNVAAISDGLAGANGNRTMSYDALDRLTATTSPMFTGGTLYEYDSLDNLTRVKAPGRDHYYCYDPNNWRLTNVKTSGCSGATVIGLDYDVQGNLAQKNSQHYLFDFGNRLRDVPNQESYRYDGYGRRVSAKASMGTIYSLYGQDGVLRSQRDERKAEAYDYVSLNGSLVARVTDPNSVIGVPTLNAPASSGPSYTVQWSAVTIATAYELQVAFNGSAWQAAYSGTATNVGQSSQPAGSYVYRVRACKNIPCGGWSATTTVVVGLPPAVAPSLAAPALAPSGNYTVSWTAVTGATSYVLDEYAAGAWMEVYNGVGLNKIYSAKPAGSYGYRIKACNTYGCSAVSATATVQSLYPPGAPTLSVPASSYTGSYTVSWAAVSGATSYQLEESANSGAWVLVQDSAAISKAYTGKADGSYSYRAKACNDAGCSTYSASASIAVLTPPTAVPTVTAPANNYTGSYTVSWTTVAKATSYNLYMSVNGGAEMSIYTGAGSSHNVSGQGAGSYAYRVLACNGAGCAAWSSPATTQVQFAPAMPASLTGSTQADPNVQGARFFEIYWSAVSGATYYDLQQTWTSTSIIYSGPNTGKGTHGRGTRTFHVRACNPAGCSAWKGPLTL